MTDIINMVVPILKDYSLLQSQLIRCLFQMSILVEGLSFLWHLFQMSVIWCLLSDVCYQMSVIRCLLSDVCYQMSVIWCLLSDVCYQMSVIWCLLTDVIRCHRNESPSTNRMIRLRENIWNRHLEQTSGTSGTSGRKMVVPILKDFGE